MFRTCCAHHANVDAQDEQMQMDEMQRVDWLIENGHVSYHPPPTRNLTQPPLFHALYQLYCSWYIRCQTLPKKDRFAIGHRIENLLLDMIVSVTGAYHTKDVSRKKELLSDANLTLESLKVVMRLAKDVHALEKRWYIKYEAQFQEIGKMLGGWISSLTKTNR